MQLLRFLGSADGDVRKGNMLIDKKHCYLCGGTKFNKRPGNVRDNPELEVLECVSCGLVFLSSFDHIRDDFYENSEMHGEESPDVQSWLRETASDDERRFQYLKQVLPNRRLLDFGCGTGGFLLKARELAATVHGVEPEIRLSNHYQSHGLTVFQNLSDISTEIRGGGVRYYNHVSCAGTYPRSKIDTR